MFFAYLMALFRPSGEARATDEAWLGAFHEGERRALEEVYVGHVRAVVDEAKKLLRTADAETVAHEIFCRMLADASMRESFRGGNLGAWLRTVTRRAAIDLLRKRRREAPAPDDDTWVTPDPARDDEERDAKRLVERFRAEILPEKYAPLFQVRFLEQLPQREAADKLGMSRSTLAYQENRVRELLATFLLTTSPKGES